MKEFKSFYKEVTAGENYDHCKCYYLTRLDTYGRGCQHDCSYCYAKSMLDFRNMWDAKDPSVADIEKIRKRIKKIPLGVPAIRLGGMTDCFQPIERTYRNTYETIKALNERGLEYLIVTKSDMVAEDEYMDILDVDLAHIQITLTCFDDETYHKINHEHAAPPSARIRAIEKLQANGFDVQIRLSPLVPEFFDLEKITAIRCDKILVEFLRANSWIKKWFDIDYSHFTVKQGGYIHLPLEEKIEYVNLLKPHFKELTVGESEPVAYDYWKYNVNPNPNDCCNLRRRSNGHKD